MRRGKASHSDRDGRLRHEHQLTDVGLLVGQFLDLTAQSREFAFQLPGFCIAAGGLFGVRLGDLLLDACCAPRPAWARCPSRAGGPGAAGVARPHRACHRASSDCHRERVRWSRRPVPGGRRFGRPVAGSRPRGPAGAPAGGRRSCREVRSSCARFSSPRTRRSPPLAARRRVGENG